MGSPAWEPTLVPRVAARWTCLEVFADTHFKTDYARLGGARLILPE
jgi:hypothetical protein